VSVSACVTLGCAMRTVFLTRNRILAYP
jgi:hypothetical protein